MKFGHGPRKRYAIRPDMSGRATEWLGRRRVPRSGPPPARGSKHEGRQDQRSEADVAKVEDALVPSVEDEVVQQPADKRTLAYLLPAEPAKLILPERQRTGNSQGGLGSDDSDGHQMSHS